MEAGRSMVKCAGERIGKFIVSMLIAFLMLLACTESLAVSDDYADISGHWAEETLRQAVSDGLINGGYGLLFPDESITIAQALVVICRALGAETEDDISGIVFACDDLYYNYIAKAVHLGLLTTVSMVNFDAPISRQDAFFLLAEAFSLVEADPDMSLLNQFSDSRLIAPLKRQAVASLISQGLVAGYEGRLEISEDITRAEFLTLVCRIVGEYVSQPNVSGRYERGVMVRGSAQASGASFLSGVVFDCAATDIAFSGVYAESAAIRSHELESLVISDSTHIKRLTVAAQSGDITVETAADSVVDTLVVGRGGGEITVKGVDAIEVTGNNRLVIIDCNAERIVVSGQNNTIVVPAGAQAGKIEFLANASGNRAQIEGNAGEVVLAGVGSVVDGGGYIESLTLFRADTEISVRYGNILDAVDRGLSEASIRIDLPEVLPVESALIATAVIENAAPGIVCDFTWHIDREPILAASITTGNTLPVLTHAFDYSPYLPGRVVVGATVSYVTALGEQQEITAQRVIELENHDRQYWMSVDAQSMIERVPFGYQGDYTLAWALENDLDDYEKEVWINARGYESATEYLIWVNLAYQRVNIFKISTDGVWELIRSFIVGTGAIGSGTPAMVTTITYRQQYGWTTTSYSCRPVVRFRPGSGFAFHSRLYYPNSTILQDSRIGFPVSHGCIRMYDEDIWYIFNNIPDGTTVVVY